MAARGVLTPFQIHAKGTTATPPAAIHTFMSWLGKASRRRRARFFCSHSLSEIDMPKYRDKFARRMEIAGLKPHHRIALAVSGGPDSTALCLLTAGWKSDDFDAAATKGRNELIDGLLAIVVDHGLRTESTEEASLVCNRVIDMGIECEVAHCVWSDGKPKPGHLQEASRDKRYEILQDICTQRKIGVLLTAHHADDQEELFIIRLSRDSGVLGLAGMAFTSELFPEFPNFSEGSKAHGLLLVRPLLEFSKEDMYNICRGGKQQSVEDPKNMSLVYTRNRIRMALSDLSSSILKAELQAVISECRKTRLHIDNLCRQLLNQSVSIMPHGYAVIDLETLNSMEVKDIYLAKFAALVLQFISQKHKPVRGNASKLLLQYLRTFPCKTCFTVAGCYLCPSPGSKGTKVLVCCSVNSSLPIDMKLFPTYSHGRQNCFPKSELEEIVKDSEASLNRFIPNASSVPFLDITSSESVLLESKRLGLLSDSTYRTIVSLQKEESETFKSKAGNASDFGVRSSDATQKKLIHPGQVAYFMNRFVLDWKICNTEEQCCSSCDEMVAEVRPMIDADWIYLSNLFKTTNLRASESQIFHELDYALLSADKALLSLKGIPIAARKAMHVLVNAKGILLSIPSIGFSCYPHLIVLIVLNLLKCKSNVLKEYPSAEGIPHFL